MKEAAGEANLTVVAIILIAVIVAVATPLINSLMKSAKFKACCTDSGGVWRNNACQTGGSTGIYGPAGYDVAGYNSCTAA